MNFDTHSEISMRFSHREDLDGPDNITSINSVQEENELNENKMLLDKFARK